MPNPFFQGSRQPSANTNNNLNDIKQAYDIFSHSKNPMDAFMKMADKNPQLQPIAQMIRSGGNPQQIFITLCNQRGINPQQFLNSITGK